MTENPSVTSARLIEWTAICNGESFDELSRRYTEHSFIERRDWARKELRTLEETLEAWLVDAVGFETKPSQRAHARATVHYMCSESRPSRT